MVPCLLIPFITPSKTLGERQHNNNKPILMMTKQSSMFLATAILIHCLFGHSENTPICGIQNVSTLCYEQGLVKKIMMLSYC